MTNNLRLIILDELNKEIASPLLFIDNYPYIPRKGDTFIIDLSIEGLDAFTFTGDEEVIEELFKIYEEEEIEFIVEKVVFSYSNTSCVELHIKNTKPINKSLYEKYVRNNYTH